MGTIILRLGGQCVDWIDRNVDERGEPNCTGETRWNILLGDGSHVGVDGIRNAGGPDRDLFGVDCAVCAPANYVADEFVLFRMLCERFRRADTGLAAGQ